MIEEITLEKLIGGELDPGTISILDLKSFCMENGLTSYEVTTDREMRDMLNEIAELLAPATTTTAPALMTVREYAEAYGMDVAEVKKRSGLVRVDQKVKPEHHRMIHEASSPATETASVPSIDEPPATEVDKKPPTRRERMAERRKLTQAAKMNATGGVKFPPHKYIHRSNKAYDALPGRIRRSVESQAGPRNTHPGYEGGE